jgi:hypothetical protein
MAPKQKANRIVLITIVELVVDLLRINESCSRMEKKTSSPLPGVMRYADSARLGTR